MAAPTYLRSVALDVVGGLMKNVSHDIAFCTSLRSQSQALLSRISFSFLVLDSIAVRRDTNWTSQFHSECLFVRFSPIYALSGHFTRPYTVFCSFTAIILNNDVNDDGDNNEHVFQTPSIYVLFYSAAKYSNSFIRFSCYCFSAASLLPWHTHLIKIVCGLCAVFMRYYMVRRHKCMHVGLSLTTI